VRFSGPRRPPPRRARRPCRNLSACWQAGNRSIAVLDLPCLFEASACSGPINGFRRNLSLPPACPYATRWFLRSWTGAFGQVSRRDLACSPAPYCPLLSRLPAPAMPRYLWVMSHWSAVPRDPSGSVTGLSTLVLASPHGWLSRAVPAGVGESREQLREHRGSGPSGSRTPRGRLVAHGEEGSTAIARSLAALPAWAERGERGHRWARGRRRARRRWWQGSS
jgi:hypothetical protein